MVGAGLVPGPRPGTPGQLSYKPGASQQIHGRAVRRGDNPWEIYVLTFAIIENVYVVLSGCLGAAPVSSCPDLIV